MKKNSLLFLFLFILMHQSRSQDFPDIAKFGSCFPNLNFAIPLCQGMATLKWTEPRDTFPSAIEIPTAIDSMKGGLLFMGTYNGHGYFQSQNLYAWPTAAVIAGSVGGMFVDSYLASVTSAGENNFIYRKIRSGGFAPWIGLFNSGSPGRFNWISGESVSYQNWFTGEPNNSGGLNGDINEPYVRMSNVNGKWNDQVDDNFKFIAEFEKPFIHYKQISGPKNGSSRRPGIYQVCYQKTNLITAKTDTCCFNIIVSCKVATTSETNASSGSIKYSDNENNKGLVASISPNPSSIYFRLQLKSNNSASNVQIKVSDIAGREIEVRNGQSSNQTLEIGKNLKPGVYFVQVTQGTKHIVLQVIKQ